MLKAEITDCPNKRMAGKELRRLRAAAGMSEMEVAMRYGTYRMQIVRWEKWRWFELPPVLMEQLLAVLGAEI